jgi:hypothetical protein
LKKKLQEKNIIFATFLRLLDTAPPGNIFHQGGATLQEKKIIF